MTVALPVESAASIAGTQPRTQRSLARPLQLASDYAALTKPRIIVLLEITAAAAMVMAARGWPGAGRMAAVLAGGALAAGGANALNMWFDRDIDSTMRRTCARPIPSGRIPAGHALVFGVSLGVSAFAVLAWGANVLAAGLALTALLFYVGVYTMYLKRSSMQNIVIGGAAGAVPPLVGWAAVTGSLDLTALFLFAVVFYWTPPHFWALALVMRNDYQRAGVPMLPVVRSGQHTRTAIVLYTVVTVLVTLLAYSAGSFGQLYLVGAVLLDGIFVAAAVAALRDASTRAALRLFHFSLVYLALLFAVMAADRVVGAV